MSAYVRLPYPPSANNLFINIKHGRAPSPRYKAWLAAAATALHGAPQIAGAYHIAIHADRPDRRARDLDNLLKPINDALKKAGVIEDDSLAVTLFAKWTGPDPVKDAKVMVSVSPVEKPAVAA